MAKVKVKLDIGAIKKWLLEHGEKLAFGFALFIFLMFTWSAVSREVLSPDKQPDQLRDTAAKVGSHVTNSRWDEKTVAISGESYQKRAKREQIDPKNYKLPVALNGPLADPKTKRATPELLPIEELKVAAGFGAFAVKSDGIAGGGAQAGAGSSLKGHAWVAVTGLIPVDKQAGEYARIFDRAQGGDRARDVPKYVGFKLERAEVTDANPNKLDWKPVIAPPFVKDFAQGPPELVHPDFVDPQLTMPLRPLVPPNWGDAVTHPKIPLAAPGNAPPQPVVEEPVAEPDAKGAADGFTGAHAGGKNAPPVAAKDDKQPEKTHDPEFAYRLLRGFDFSVDPNKKYRYRVVVRLENPNFGVSRQYLSDPDTATHEYLDTAVTEPSGVVSVPDGYQVLAGSVPQPKVREPTAKLMLIAIDAESGMEATHEHEVQRGSIANAIIKDLKVRDPLNPQQMKEMPSVNFKTDMVVLDIRGGKPLGRKEIKLTAPGEVLLLDRNGDLVVHSEMDDHSMYEARVIPAEEPEKRPDPIEPARRPANRRPKQR
jgi:hypothetical protein